VVLNICCLKASRKSTKLSDFSVIYWRYLIELD
jgi:hypothetical protein